MKKILVFAVAAMTALVACNKDPEVNKEDNGGNENENTNTGGATGLCINEVNGTSGYKGIELYNPGDAAVDLKDWSIKKNNEVDDDTAGTKLYWKGVSGSVPAKGFFVIHANKDDASLPEKVGDGSDVATGGLSAKKAVKLELVNPEGKTVDTFNRGWDDNAENPEVSLKEYTEGSFARTADGGDTWKVLAPTFGATNAGAAVITETIENE